MTDASGPLAVAASAGRSVAAQARPSPRAWNTLQRLLALRTALLVVSALLLVLLLATAEGIREATHNLASQQVPSLVASEQIAASLSAMDAAFAAQLLSPAGREADLGETYNTDRTEVVRGLMHAAQSLAVSGVEPTALESLQAQLGEYERLLQRSRDLGEREASAALPVYRQATGVLDRQLQPAAAELNRLATKALDAASSAASLQYRILTALRVLVGLALLSLLTLTQAFLSRTTRRTLNLPLLTGTLLFLVGGAHLLSLLAGTEATLLQARSGTVVSLQQILVTRSATLAADDQLSRALLDRTQEATAEAAFLRDASDIAAMPDLLPGGTLLAALREGRSVDGFTGALANITQGSASYSERRPALVTLAAWQQYQAVAQRIFRLEGNGQPHDALLRGSGSGAEDLPALRTRLLATLDALQTSRQRALTSSLQETDRALRVATVESCVGIPLLAVLIFWGLTPGVREYQTH